MKSTITCLLMFILSSYTLSAQKIAINNTDKKTGNQVIITANKKGEVHEKSDTVANNGMVFFSAGYQKATLSGKETATYTIELDIVHNDNRLGCMQEFNSKIVLMLEDGSEVECFQISDTDCGENTFKAAFALMPYKKDPALMVQNFEKLQTTGVKKLLVYTTAKPLEFVIPKRKRAYVQEHFVLLNKTINSPATK